MYSVRKTRSLSICLLMVLSAMGPIAVPAAADHEEEDWPYFDLLIEYETGTWELLEPNTMFEVEAGTYDMQIDYYNLDVGSNYTLMWNTYGIHEDGGGMQGNVSSENVTDTWQMEVSEFDCWYNAVVEIINTTDGAWDDVDHRDYDFHGECMEYGTVTPSAEINGTWVSEPDELEPGTYQMSWDVTNLTTGGEYKLDYWYYLTGNMWDESRNITEYAWDATGSEENIGWNVTVTEFDCTLQPEALLWQNTTTGWTVIDQYWVGSWSEVISLPCESMMTAYIWLDEEGDWVELANRNSADYWPHNFPNDNTCEEFWDLDGDGNEDHWWECTDPDTGDVEEFDECHEYYDEQTDEDMLDCFINYEPMYLEEGVYNVTLEIAGLSVGEEYFLYGELWESGVWDYESNYYELGFTAPTEEVSEVVYLVISAETCSTGFDLSLSHNETVDGMEHSEELESISVYVNGPCEQPPSPFTLYYDGMEHEQVTHYTEYDVCDEYEDGYFECWMDDWDEDGDGEPEWTDWRDDCEEDSNGTWWCVDWHEDPHIDAGDHTMTWNVSDLEEDVEYEVEWAVQVNQNMGGWDYYNTEFYAFNATGNTQSQDVYELIDWYLETDNFTCNVNIQIELYENESDGSGNWHFNRVGWDHFNFKGPCEQPPSPFTLYYDGMEYERVANNMTGFDGCDEYDDGYFECYIDYDGDGNWDDWYGFEECSNLSTGWECVEWYEDPFVEEGNHTGWLDVEGLEADGSYMLEWYDQRCTQQGCEGMSGDWGGPFNVSDLWDYDSADGIWTHDDYYFNTNNETCHYSSEFWLYEVQWDDQDNWWPGNQIFNEEFVFRGPCEQPPSPFTLYYDGMEYERTAHNMTGFEWCDDNGDHFECYIDYDGDGNWDDWYDFEECSNLSTGWECVEWYEDPHIDAGNHSMTLEIEDLETGLNYSVSIQININTQQGGEYEEGYEDFTASSDTYSTSGHIETDNFTCNLNIHVSLDENESDGSGNWWHHQIAWDWFNFKGPCEEPPSPFTLYYDGMEYERVAHNMTGFDGCDEYDDGYFECWIGYDWDGDGEPDDYEYWGFDECSNLSTGWECVEWFEDPTLYSGNHSMTLEIEDLETGLNYTVSIQININTQQGGEYEEGYEDFTASSDTYSTSGHIETDNFTCNLNIHVSLNENESDGSGNWWHHQIAYDWFNFRGPCEQPPSPFTLYYDGIEYEQIIHYNEYDQCEDDTGGSGIEQYRCWDDDWDGDGDGEPDYWDYQYNCEEDANGTWWCEGWHQNPYIDAGNHSMTLEVLDLEAGTSYAVMYNTDVCTSMMGCEWDSFEELFNASSDVESLSFFLETDNSTCNANIHATLYEVSWDEDGNWWHDRHLFGESFGFDGPCEQPPSPIHLIYTDENGDEVEWEPEMESHEYDECDDYGDHFECWYNDEGDEMIWEDDCEQNSNGTWLCESLGGSPDIAEGDHNMMWNVTDLEDGKNYSLMWTVYSMSMMGYDMDEGQENFTASSDAHDIDWSLHVDNSTCNVIINAQLAQPVDYDEDGIVDWYDYVAYTGFNFNGPCEMSLPVDIGLEIEDGGAWFDVEGVPLEVIFCEDCDYDEGDEMGLILQYVGYNLTAAGEYDLRWTLSGLTVGENYTFEYGPEGPGDSDGDVYWDIYSYCEWEGTDEGDERWWCTDDGDGSDGFDDWWFYCEYDAEDDQWWCTDDFGQNPDWEFSADGTEHEGADGAQGQGDEYEWTAASETEEISWAIGIGNDTCVLMIQGQAYSSNEWGDEMFAGMFIGVITGPAFAHDDNGNGMPDCMEMGPGPGPGPDGPHMGSEMGHLALGLDDGMGDFMEPFPYQHLDVGTYDMAFAAMDLEPTENYVLSFSVGIAGEESTVNITADDDGWAQHNFSITLTDWSCFIIVRADLAYVAASGYQWIDSFLMILEGPCMGGSLEGLISAEAIDENGMSHALTNDEGYREFLDHGAYEVVVEISGLTVGTDYTVNYAYLEGAWGVADVIAQLWDTEGVGDEWNFTASSSNESFSLWIEIHDYTCGAFMLVELGVQVTSESHDFAYAFIDTPCGDGEGGWDPMMFATGIGYNTAFYGISDDSDGTAMVYVERVVTLDDEFRMKVDADFGNGDGYLNQTEADEFAGMLAQGMAESDDPPDAPDDLLLNGVAPSYNLTVGLFFVDLANDSMGSPQMGLGWTIYYDTGADAAGNYALSYAGEDDDDGDEDDEGGDDLFPFETTLCAYTQADGYHLVYAEINGTEVSEITGAELYLSHCWTLAPWEEVLPFTVTWGQIDSDGDGVGDLDDRFPDDPNEWDDSDYDGVGDNADDFPDDASEQNDADGDGVGDNSDDFPWDPSESADTDGDGYGDNGDAFPDDDTEWVDTDGDGTGDNADTDADGDGIDDDAEDSDGDGVYDDQDAFPFDANETADSDGDGVGDNGDAFPNDANETTDTDGDGIGDNSDDDADGDGQPNDLDDFPLNSEESSDGDGDGVGDNEDAFPNDPSEYIDSDGDGIGDNGDPDDDNDGTPDASDAFPLDDTESADTDNDGTGDNADAFPNDPYERHDSDGDGVGDNTDPFPSNPSEWSDADNDGTGDNSDGFPNDPNEIVDSDGDGVGNNADAFPFDNTETADSDGDGVGDNAQANEGQEPEVIEPEPDDGGWLPGFSVATSLVSMLGAAILIAGRRKD